MTIELLDRSTAAESSGRSIDPIVPLELGSTLMRIVGASDSDRMQSRIERTVSKALANSGFDGTILVNADEQRSLGMLASKIQMELKSSVEVHQASENHSLIPLVRDFLATSKENQYHAIFVGGTDATRIEYQRTIESLLNQFPGRVHVTILYGAGGVSDYLAQSSPSSVHVCNIRSSDLTKNLRETLRVTRADQQVSSRSDDRGSAESTFSRGELGRFVDQIGISDPALKRGLISTLGQIVDDQERIIEQRFSDQVTSAQLQRLNREERLLTRRLSDQLQIPLTSDAYDGQQVLARRVTKAVAQVVAEMQERSREFSSRVSIFNARDLLVGDIIERNQGRLLLTERPTWAAGESTVLLTGVQISESKSPTFVRQQVQISSDAPLEVDRLRMPLPRKRDQLQAGELSENSVLLPSTGLSFIAQGSWHLVVYKSSDQVFLLTRSLEARSKLQFNILKDGEFENLTKGARGVRALDILGSQSRDLIINQLSGEAVLDSLNPTKVLPSGAIIEMANERFVVAELTSGEKALVEVSQCGATSTPITPLVALGGDAEQVGDTRSMLLKSIAVNDFPEINPRWSQLHHGGIILYSDANGQLVAHEEVLNVQVIERQGAESQQSVQVTSLRTDATSGRCTLSTENRSQIDLFVPPNDLPHVFRVDVYRSADEMVSPRSIPQPQPQRSHAWISHDLEGHLEVAVESAFALLKQGGKRELCNQFAHGSSQSTELLEDTLREHKELFEIGKFALEECREWFGRVVSHEPAAAQTLATLHHNLSDKSSLHNLSAESLADHFDQLALEVRKISEGVETGSSQLGGDFARSLGSLGAALRRSSLVRTMAHAPNVDVYTQDNFRLDDLIACSKLAEDAELKPSKFSKENPLADHFRLRGGFLINDYSVEYFRQALEKGGRLIIHSSVSDQSPRVVDAFELFFPPNAVPEYFQHLVPLAARHDRASKDVVCSRKQGATRILNEVTLLELQYTEANHIVAIINAFNDPSMRMMDKNRFTLRGDVSMDQSSEATKELFHFPVWEAPVAPAIRARWAQRNLLEREMADERKVMLNQDERGALAATAHELDQMRSLRDTLGDLPVTRFSVTLDQQMQPQFRNLVASGVFDGLQGIVSLSEAQSVDMRQGTFAVSDNSLRQLMQPIVRAAGETFYQVGFALKRPNVSSAEQLISVCGADGELKQALVLDQQGDGGSQLLVAMPQTYPVTRGVVSEEGTLNIEQLEEMRAAEFARLFSDELTIFAGGHNGTITAESIERTIRNIASRHGGKGHVVLLEGFGGVVDELCQSQQFRESVAALESSIGKKVVHITSCLVEPEHLREILIDLDRIRPSEQRTHQDVQDLPSSDSTLAPFLKLSI